jgi:hypothetical protein
MLESPVGETRGMSRKRFLLTLVAVAAVAVPASVALAALIPNCDGNICLTSVQGDTCQAGADCLLRVQATPKTIYYSLSRPPTGGVELGVSHSSGGRVEFNYRCTSDGEISVGFLRREGSNQTPTPGSPSVAIDCLQ